MARKKRGGKAAANRKTTKLIPKQAENLINEETVGQSPTESEESCSSGTPKSCTTPPVEATEKSVQIQHKKFGKFRCLLDETSSKNEVSSSESELQMETLEVDPNNVEIITLETDNIIEDLKSIEITESETIQDIPICSEEIIQEEIAEDCIELTEEEVTEIPIMIVMETDDKNTILLQSDESQEQSISSENNSSETTKNDEEDAKQADLNETEQNEAKKPDSNSETTTVRRSSRIKSISVLKQRSKGHGLVKSDKKDKIYKPTKNLSSDLESICENSSSNASSSDKNAGQDLSFTAPVTSSDSEQKPVKVKSRWRRSSELEMGSSSPITGLTSCPQTSPHAISDSVEMQTCAPNPKDEFPEYDEEMENRLRQFQSILENQYLTDRTSCKEAKKMVCDCFLTKEEIERGEYGCGEDCLNRLLMIECGSQCIVGDRCTNKRFQKQHYAGCEVFRTEKKGFGIRATTDIPYNEFILEYVGEVLDPDEFDKRAKEYSKDKNRHYYFMALRADAVIDATQKGNISRFINHSCDPNAETQKWTVNGELRIGFFSKRTILANEEITFDYQFQRYGKEAQKCYCESASCRGWIGEEPQEEGDEEDDEDSGSDEGDEEEEEEGKEDGEARSDLDPNNLETDLKEPKQLIKRQVRKRRLNKKQRKDIFEDLDLDEEIGILSATGIKNQAHTLRLSRLMVRAKDVAPRMELLKLLKNGDLPCRRLFLDYHGLRLIHGWMCDVANMTDSENIDNLFRIEILETLEQLPIPNKTMLQDSKVLSMVEKWSTNKTESISPTDSVSNSPQIDSISNETSAKKDEQPMDIEKQPKIEPMELEIKVEDFTEDIKIDLSKPDLAQIEIIEDKIEVEIIVEDAKEIIEEIEDAKDEDLKPKENLKDKIKSLIVKLLVKWSELKEVFRIPKKERIEQMKEHEREADRDYKADLGLETELKTRGASYSWKSDRYRLLEKEKRKPKEILEKKNTRIDERNIVPIPKLSKHERRQLFALQVAQEEEGRRRKHEQEMWHIQQQRCMVMGTDPRLATNLANPIELPPLNPLNPPTPTYQCYWNPNTAQWQNYPCIPGQQPPPPQIYGPPPGGPPGGPGGMMMPPGVPGVPGVRPAPQQYPPPLHQVKEEVVFTAPPPPPLPVKLPPKWKCARDKYGRPYYYHIKVRVSQWEPPEFPVPVVEETLPELMEESSSSTETSSLSSDSSTDSDEDSEIGDTKLLLEIRNKLKHMEPKPPLINPEILVPVSSGLSLSTIDSGQQIIDSPKLESIEELPKKSVEVTPRRKREGLVQEIIISPRREEDKASSKLELKKYKETKEKLRRHKQLILEQTKKRLKGKLNRSGSSSSKSSKKHRSSKSLKLKNIGAMVDMNSEEAKKIKEHFRSSMASVMVQNLNAYRKPDCKIGRITNTDDFKHLARKLTHFVMLKELKHCKSIEDLTCNDSVKAKAKDFVKKYMAKFGDIYSRPKDELD